jgi:hypothetical protein
MTPSAAALCAIRAVRTSAPADASHRPPGHCKPAIVTAYAERLDFMGPLALSMAGPWRVWLGRGPCLVHAAPYCTTAPQCPRRTFLAQGFALAAVLWLAYGLYTGYARFLPAADRAWQLAVHASALWSVPLFISAIVWAASIAMGWVMRLLQREGEHGARSR